MRDAFIERLDWLAGLDPKIFLITGDLGFGVLDAFASHHPRQFLNAGVAEQNMTGLATGLALEGRIVFTYSIANFATLRCLEQIRNDAAYHEADVKVVAIGGGFSYGSLGMSHHATEDLAIMRAIGVTVVAPGCDWEASAVADALVTTPGTCYVRLDRAAVGSTQRAGEIFSIGQARRVREGEDVTLISTGGILQLALSTAEVLGRRNIGCRVISMHTLEPLDREAILSAARDTGGIVTIEEHTVIGGLGSAVAQTCLESGVAPRAFRSVGMRAGFSSIVGSQNYLRERYDMDGPAIIAAVEEVLRNNGLAVPD